MSIGKTSDLSSVDTAQIVDGAITSAKIADNAVVAAKINAGAVGSAALADNAVVAAKIAAGSVGSAALASGSVNSSILASNAVVAASIAAAAVGTAAMSSGSATNGHVLTANGSGGASFQAVSAREAKVVSGKTTVSTSSITGLSGEYYLKNLRKSNIDIVVSSVTSTLVGDSFVRINSVSNLTKMFAIAPFINVGSQTQGGVGGAKGVATDGKTIIIGDAAAAGKYLISTDGINFSAKTYGSTTVVTKAYYGGGIFVLLGLAGNIWTSPNGITWTQRTSGFGTTAIRGGTYGNGIHVVVGDSGKLAYSTDGGENWTFSTPFVVGNEDVAFGNGLFITVGSQYSGTPIFTSTNGSSWTQRAGGTGGANLDSVAYGDGLWIAITSGTQTRSIDGVTWTSGASPQGSYINYINGYWIAQGAGTAQISSNGASTFTSRSTGAYNVKNGAYHEESGKMIFSSVTSATGAASTTITDAGIIDVEFTPISYQSITS